MSNNKSELVSIILPTHNRASQIGQAIDAVLDQSYTNWELIVVDGASTDDTPSVVESYCKREPKIRYHRSFPRQGLPKDRNIGVSQARGNLIYMIEDDLIMEIDCLETLVRTLTELKVRGVNVGAVAPKTLSEFPEESRLMLLMRYASKRKRRHMNTPTYMNNLVGIVVTNFGMQSDQILEILSCPSWSLISKDAFIEVGGFEGEAYNKYNFFYEEADFYFKLRERGYKLYFQSKAVTHHKRAASGGTRSSAIEYYYNFTRSHIYFLGKHFGWKALYMVPCTFPYLIYNTITGVIEMTRRRR